MAVDTAVTVRIVAVQCGNCHAWFGLDASFHQRVAETGEKFTCPCCNTRIWYSQSENQRLKDEIARQKHATEQAQASRDYWQSEEKHTQHRLRAHKGVVTKLKKRVTKGACPCCHRKFKDLRDHMKAEHPDWNPEKGAEAIAAKGKE